MESHGRCFDAREDPGGTPPAVSEPVAVALPVPQPVATSPPPAEEPFKKYNGAAKFGVLTIPLAWKVARAHVDDPELAEIVSQIRNVQQQLAATPSGPARRALLDDLLEAGARRRARMLTLKENEASLAFALMILLESWKHPEFLDRPPRHTGLVATFRGTEQGGTVYCERIAAAAGNGGAAAGLDAFQAKNACEGREYQSFMIVEAIADKGGVDGMDLCVIVATQGGGSYQILLDCMRDDAMRAALASTTPSSDSSGKPTRSGGKKRSEPSSLAPPAQIESPAPRACCRQCNNGKPCGDACIPRDRICHVGPGCAC